jgi:DNA polymerase-3 subunit alpha
MMQDFFNNFSEYKNCVPPGVRLPQIEIESKYYKSLKLDSGVDNFTFLTELCKNSLKKKNLNKEYLKRTKSELAILKKLGFVDYILLNWDIINFCHENDIPVGPGRGSAAGSLVLFLIGVTSVDPVKHDLFFERFVSESRAKQIEKDGVVYLDGSLLADVDNDIAYEHRQRVIDYIETKNPSRTSKILTLNSLSSKLCIKECGKIVSELSEKDVNLVSDFIPKKFGKVFSLSQSLQESERFAAWTKKYPESFKIAQKLEGLYKNTGVHPSGIAICFYEISEICPLQSTNDGSIVTGYDMNWVSELMVKFDILGLRTLSVIYDVCKALGLNVYDIDLDDQKLYQPLQDSLRSPQGLFQIEADTNFRVCQAVKPRNLEELSAVIAIARPGALEFSDSYADYIRTGESNEVHDFFSDVLSYTGGIPLYQEQLMKMAVKVGFSLDESEQLRRIVGKKKVDQMASWQEKISKKVQKNNLPEEVGEVLWSVAEDSANYSFNKSHSIAYATLAAWTTFLKFNHTQDFFLSLLKMTKFEPSPQEEISDITKDLPFFDMKLLPPDLERSQMDFAKEGKHIRFGLNSIKGVSEKSLEALGKFRSSDKPNKFNTFVAAKQSGLNIGILSSLIQAGCLPEYDSSRPLLVLEAQSFNLLTDREKKCVIEIGEKYDYKLLDIIAEAHKGLLASDGKPLMKESRFNTFKSKYDKYKAIYLQNKKYERFANWYFETKLLGYSYSGDLKSVFNESEIIYNSNNFYDEKSCRGKFIGVVNDYYKGVSRNGNKYFKMILSDEYGKYPVMFMDNSRGNKYSDYLELGNQLPEKDDIIAIIGTKSSDIVFADHLLPLKEKIYMKLGDLN